MARTATITTRVEPELKEEVSRIFKSLGISTTEAINLFLQKVNTFKTLPFEADIPNKETLEVINNTDAGKDLFEFESIEAFHKSLGI